MKDLKNMTHDEFKEICDETDHFLGKKLNAEKKKQLDQLFALCKSIAKADRKIAFEAMPFTERSRNGMAVLDMPRLGFYTEPPVRELLAKALELADAFGTSTGGNKITISFFVHDMWDEWGRTDDEEHKGQYVGNLKIVK